MDLNSESASHMLSAAPTDYTKWLQKTGMYTSGGEEVAEARHTLSLTAPIDESHDYKTMATELMF